MRTKTKPFTQPQPYRWMRACSKTFLLALILCGAAIATQAQRIISLDVFAGVVGTDRNTMDPVNDYAGAPGVRTNMWNMIGANTLNSGSTTDGTITNGTISDSGGNVLANLGGNIHAYTYDDRLAGAGDSKMFGDDADQEGGTNVGGVFSSGYGYLSLTNIPYTNYNIYCYFYADNGSGSGNTRGGFWLITNTPIGAERIYIKNQSNDVNNTQIPTPSSTDYTNTYVQSTTTSINPGGVTWSSIQGGNYGVFSGLTNANVTIWFGALGNGHGSVSTVSGAAGYDDLGNWVSGGSGNVRMKACGFQIAEVVLGQPTNVMFLAPYPTNLLAGNPATFPLTVESLNNDGTSNNITSQLGVTYSSANTNIFTVSPIGIISPGLQAGTTNLVVQYAGTWSSLYATQSVTVLGPTSLSSTVDKASLYLGKNGVIDFTKPHLFAGYNSPTFTNVEVTSFNGVSIGNATPATISFANGLITPVAAGNFGISGTYGGLNATLNPAGTVQYFVPVGNPGISVKLTDQLPPSAYAMLFTALAGVPGGSANTDVTGLGVRLPYWNNLVTPNVVGLSSNQLSAPLDSGGNVLSNVVVQFSAVTSDGGTTRPSVPIVTTNESQLWGTYWDVGLNNSSITASNTGYVIISNVPYAHYDVYFYMYNDNSSSGSARVGEFTIGGVTKYRLNDPALPNPTYGPNNSGTINYEEATDTSPPNSPPASINDGNLVSGDFVRFTNITSSTLTVNFAAMASDLVTLADPNPRLRLVGFQIVEPLDGLTATNLYLSPASVPVQTAAAAHSMASPCWPTLATAPKAG